MLEKNYRTIVAGIDASNDSSIKLHEKFNFKHAGTIQNVGYKFDRWLDLAFYQYDLHDKKKVSESLLLHFFLSSFQKVFLLMKEFFLK